VSVTADPPEGFRTNSEKPAGTRLVLIRHGEAWCNRDGVVGGPRGCGGLTDLGRRQAQTLAERLVFSRELMDAAALYTSLLPRSMETAAILAPGLPSLDVVADCDLCELHPGAADAMTWQEVLDHFGAPDWDPDPDTPIAPGGESWGSFYDRCVEVLARIAARHVGELVVLVVHGGVIEQAMKIMQGSTRGARLKLRTEHCSMTEIEVRDGSERLLRYNDRAPLAG
jgi:probable phosphoglycerate mutase